MAKRVKIKELKSITGGGDINGMFEEMIGIRDAEPEIIIPKYAESIVIVQKVHNVLLQLCTFKRYTTAFPDLEDAFLDIHSFITNMQGSIKYNIGENEQQIEQRLATIKKEHLNHTWKEFKNDQYIKTLICLCGRLKQYKSFLDDKNDLQDRFIKREPGLSFMIFDFSRLDLKKLWVHDNIVPNDKKYMLTVLYVLWRELYKLYKLITSPDVDIDKFIDVLIKCLGDLKKRPELNRCTNAFARIESSVELLRDNFDNYYRESVASKNPNMIMENFIIDVSNKGEASARLTREFRIIIQYMHKSSVASGQHKNPQFKKLFGALNQHFTTMERETKTTTADDNETTLDEDNVDLSLKENEEISIYKPKPNNKVAKKRG